MTRCHHCKHRATKYLVDNNKIMKKLTFIRVCCNTCFRNYFSWEVQMGRLSVLSRKEYLAFQVIES